MISSYRKSRKILLWKDNESPQITPSINPSYVLLFIELARPQLCLHTSALWFFFPLKAHTINFLLSPSHYIGFLWNEKENRKAKKFIFNLPILQKEIWKFLTSRLTTIITASGLSLYQQNLLILLHTQPLHTVSCGTLVSCCEKGLIH